MIIKDLKCISYFCFSVQDEQKIRQQSIFAVTILDPRAAHYICKSSVTSEVQPTENSVMLP